MALQFCIGSSGSGKSNRLYTDVIKQSLEETDTKFFIIVPDQFTMQTQKELVMRHPNRGIMNIDVLSFGRLTHRIFEETGGCRQPVLDDTGKSLILRKIAADCEDSLTVIGSHVRRIGYIHEVKSAISEFMQYGIGKTELEALTAYARPRGSLYYKLKDLEILYSRFMDAITDKFVTTEGQLGLLAEVLEQSEMIKDSIVVFDGFTGFTPVQNQVIKKLLLLAREVKVAVLMDGSEEPMANEGEQKLFAFSKKMIRSHVEQAEGAGVERLPDIVFREKPVMRFRDNRGMAHLEEALFRYRNQIFEGEQDAIHIIEAVSPGEEVRQTCIRIRRLIREKGYQYRDIAVVAGDLSVYGDYVEEIFGQFSIPCYVDRSSSIALNPFIEYIRSGLKVLLQNFSYESVFHFLRSGLGDISMEETDKLENYVLRHGIRGRRRWCELFVRRNGEENEAEELEEINAVRQKLTDRLQPLMTGGKRVKDYVISLYTFLTENKVYEQLISMENKFQEEGDLVKAKEYGQIYPLVMELLEQIYDLIGEEEMDLQEFADILDAGFGEIQVGTIPQNVDRILVGDIERTRLQEIKVLFFLGVNDGNIPKSGTGGGIISDIDREFLARGQWEMAPSPREQMYIQRLYLYMNMTKPSERLYLSYARINGEGKAIRPAYLTGIVKKMFPKIKVEIPDREPLQEQVEIKEDGFGILAGQLREYARGNVLPMSFFFTLYRVYARDSDYREKLERLVEAAFYRYQNSSLGRDIAHALYGSILTCSVSRLEQYASCAYSYFLQYGLSLKEREQFAFEAVDMGNLFHSVLEQFARLLEDRGIDWFSFSQDQGEALIEEAVDAQAALYGDNILFSNARYLYVITRIKRILKRTVFTLQNQLKKGKFLPEHFEVSFSRLTDVESVNISLSETEKMRLQGRIDRIDTCREEDTVYVKVIDYKSGNKKLDIAAVYYGLQLQLIVYMNAAVEMTGKKETGKKAVPAAMLYYHVSDPLIRAEDDRMNEEDINEKIRESLRMNGIVNGREDIIKRLDETFGDRSEVIPVERKKDGSLSSRSGTLSDDELQVLSKYVTKKIKTLGSQILQGEIGKEPYAYGTETGCDYCAYRSVCGFNERIPGYEKKRLHDMTKEEALQKMQQEEQEGSR